MKQYSAKTKVAVGLLATTAVVGGGWMLLNMETHNSVEASASA